MEAPLSTNKKINRQCSHDAFNADQLRGWRYCFWEIYGQRNTARNCASGFATVYLFMFIILLAIGIAFSIVFPFKLWGILFLFSLTAGILGCLIQTANEQRVSSLLLVIGAAIALWQQWQWGLMIFGVHCEMYFYRMILGAGCIALLRRTYNAIIWGVLDHIVLHAERYPINKNWSPYDQSDE